MGEEPTALALACVCAAAAASPQQPLVVPPLNDEPASSPCSHVLASHADFSTWDETKLCPFPSHWKGGQRHADMALCMHVTCMPTGGFTEGGGGTWREEKQCAYHSRGSGTQLDTSGALVLLKTDALHLDGPHLVLLLNHAISLCVVQVGSADFVCAQVRWGRLLPCQHMTKTSDQNIGGRGESSFPPFLF